MRVRAGAYTQAHRKEIEAYCELELTRIRKQTERNLMHVMLRVRAGAYTRAHRKEIEAYCELELTHFREETERNLRHVASESLRVYARRPKIIRGMLRVGAYAYTQEDRKE